MTSSINPNSNPLAVKPGAYHRALAEGAPALSLLAQAALTAIDGGKVEPMEGLAIAGLFFRMAGEREEPAAGINHLAHAETMLRRERLERDAGEDAHAAVSGAFALRALGRAADDGNETAAARLNEVASHLLPDAHTIAQSWAAGAGAEEHAGYDAALRLASEGGAEPLVNVIMEAIQAERDGVMKTVEALALCEQAGRLGAAAGHGGLAVRLAGALLSRGCFERGAGHDDRATAKEAEGLTVLATATRAGSPEAGDLLAQVVAATPAASINLAATVDPSILAALPASGRA